MHSKVAFSFPVKAAPLAAGTPSLQITSLATPETRELYSALKSLPKQDSPAVDSAESETTIGTKKRKYKI